jgi:hypothetical protein
MYKALWGKKRVFHHWQAPLTELWALFNRQELGLEGHLFTFLVGSNSDPMTATHPQWPHCLPFDPTS